MTSLFQVRFFYKNNCLVWNRALHQIIFILAQKISTVVEQHYNGNALTMAVQDGSAAGQTVGTT